MYEFLEKVVSRPKYSQNIPQIICGRISTLSKRMLEFHLNENIDAASRGHKAIDNTVNFLKQRFKISHEMKIIDYGCGPGLYATQLAESKAEVVGVDFSETSIEFAKEKARTPDLNLNFIKADYLKYSPNKKFNIALLIYCDLCALSRSQREIFYKNVYNALEENGYFVFDIYSFVAMKQKKESQLIQRNLMDHFWNAEAYIGLMQTFVYREENVTLDKYDIFTPTEHKEIYNWLEYFSLEKMRQELKENGFSIESHYSNLQGDPYADDSQEIAIVAKKESSFSRAR